MGIEGEGGLATVRFVDGGVDCDVAGLSSQRIGGVYNYTSTGIQGRLDRGG